MSETKRSIKLPKTPDAKGHVFFWLAAGALLSVTIAVLANHFLFRHVDEEAHELVHISSLAISLAFLGPLLAYLTAKVGELRRLNNLLAVMADTDSMTGLLNRTAFADRVSELTEAAAGGKADPRIAFFVIDADHFKQINDRWGHQAGDAALREIAKVIRNAVRRSDMVGRLGGEEFGIALAGASAEDAFFVAERIRQSVASIRFFQNGTRHQLSVSIGVSVAIGPASFSALFSDADRRMYEAKMNGRDRCYAGILGKPSLPTDGDISALLRDAMANVGDGVSPHLRVVSG